MKSDNPQVLLQMASVHRHGASGSEHLQSGVESMENRMEAMMQEAITTGDKPFLDDIAFGTMLDALTTIETQLGTEKDANDQAWLAAVNAVKACNTRTTSALGDADADVPTGVRQLETEMETAKETHLSCRSDEDTKRKTQKAAHDDMKQQTQEALNDKDDKVSCQTTRSPKELWDVLVAAGVWSNNHETDVANSITAFKDATTAADDKASQCDQDQTAFELDFCQYKVALTTTCSNHDTCIKRTVKARDDKRSELEKKEAAEKIILKSCNKVRCYLQIIKEKHSITQDMYDGCKNGDGTLKADRTWDKEGTRVLDINWVDEVDADKCDVTPVDVAPGADTWFEEQYKALPTGSGWLPAKVGIEASMNCDHHIPHARKAFKEVWRTQCIGDDQEIYKPGIVKTDDNYFDIAEACAKEVLARNDGTIAFTVASHLATPTCALSKTCTEANAAADPTDNYISYFKKAPSGFRSEWHSKTADRQ